MKQGDVYWSTFRAPDKRRPVLILTRNSAIPYLTGITVAQVTTTIRGMASEVELTPGEDGMLAECVVNADNIQTILGGSIGHELGTSAIGGIAGHLAQKGLEKGVAYLFDLGADLGADWKPVCFGEWYKARIQSLLDKER